MEKNNQYSLTERRSRYDEVVPLYDPFLRLTGFKRGVEHFLDRLHLSFSPGARIYDPGCGTGIVSRYFLRRFPEVEIIASDISPKMLLAMRRTLLNSRRLSTARVRLAQGDLASPEKLYFLDSKEKVLLPESYFDGIFVSGALEHVPLEETVLKLTRLLKPGGVLLNLSMKDNAMGAFFRVAYEFRPYTIEEMRRAFILAGLDDIGVISLRPREFPANLSRVAVIAKKPR